MSLRRVQVVAAKAVLEVQAAVELVGQVCVFVDEESCEQRGKHAEGNPVSAYGSWGGRQVPQNLVSRPEPSAAVEYRFGAEGRGPDILVHGLVKQGDTATCLAKSSARELLGTQGVEAAGGAGFCEVMHEQSNLAASVQSSAGELLGTNGWHAVVVAGVAGGSFFANTFGEEFFEKLEITRISQAHLATAR